MRFPTGRAADFQGTGDFWMTPGVLRLDAAVGSRRAVRERSPSTSTRNDFTQSQARYGAGVDVDIVSRFGLVFAFLGRSQFEDPVNQPPRPTSSTSPRSGVQPQPLLGIDLGRKDFFDFSFGFRAVVWRSVMLFANGIYALNSQGLRNDTVIPTVGVEGTF